MEDFLATKITTDPTILAEFEVDDEGNNRTVEEWFFGPSSLGLGEHVAVPMRPYMVWKENPDLEHPEVSETSHARTRSFNIYVYDWKGDFTRINRILAAVKVLVKGMAPFVVTVEDEADIRCSGSKWNGLSQNLVDDGYDSCCRYGNATFTVSR